VLSATDVGDIANKLLSSFLLLSPGSSSAGNWLVSFERVPVEMKVDVAVGFCDGRRSQKPQDAAHCSCIISKVEQNRVIILQYVIKSEHVGSALGAAVGSGEGCLEGPADGEIDGDDVGLIVLLLQVPQDTGQSLWISFLIS